MTGSGKKKSLSKNTISSQNNKKQIKRKSQKSQKSSSKKKKLKRKWEKIKILLLLIFFLTFVFEILISKCGTKAIFVNIIGAVLSFLGITIRKVLELSSSSDCNNTNTCKEPLNKVKAGIKMIWEHINNNNVYYLVSFATCIILLSTILAYFHTVGWCIALTENVFDAINPTKSKSAFVDRSPTSENESDDNEDYIDKDTSIAADMVLEDLDRKVVLESDEKNEIYFKTGECMIRHNWPLTQISQHIDSDLDNLLSTKKSDQYTGYTTSEIDDATAQLSDLNSRLKSSKELDFIIEKRKSIYEEYPMDILAKLIAENYAHFGLEYYKAGGENSTIEYYYGQAILWYREVLRYNPSNDKIKEILYSLGDRYHDLAACLPQNSENQLIAATLADVYYRTSAGYSN